MIIINITINKIIKIIICIPKNKKKIKKETINFYMFYSN